MNIGLLILLGWEARRMLGAFEMAFAVAMRASSSRAELHMPAIMLWKPAVSSPGTTPTSEQQRSFL